MFSSFKMSIVYMYHLNQRDQLRFLLNSNYFHNKALSKTSYLSIENDNGDFTLLFIGFITLIFCGAQK